MFCHTRTKCLNDFVWRSQSEPKKRLKKTKTFIKKQKHFQRGRARTQRLTTEGERLTTVEGAYYAPMPPAYYTLSFNMGEHTVVVILLILLAICVIMDGCEHTAGAHIHGFWINRGF